MVQTVGITKAITILYAVINSAFVGAKQKATISPTQPKSPNPFASPSSSVCDRAQYNLNEAHAKFNLSQTAEPQFFTEWFEDLPELSDREKSSLNRLKNRYLYYAADGAITEGTVNVIMVSPLLELMGLCDPPFKIRGKKYVKVEIEDQDESEPVLEGFIDALVIQNQFWVLLIESKRYGLSVMQALPQTLAYMMANPNLEMPVFGMITTGEDYIFIKVNQQLHQYALSHKFTLISDDNNNLHRVMQVMKRIIERFVGAG